MSVFARPTDAVTACVELQRAFRREVWPEGVQLTVRIAAHTGEAQPRAGDYFGRTVNRAARLRGIALGGQVLCSRATADLVADALPEGAALVDIGRRELRDLERPEHVFALAHPDLAPLPPGGTRPSGPGAGRPPLPARLATFPPTGFVGREMERGVLREALKAAGHGARQGVLVAGEAGIGKSRLAAEVARSAHEEGFAVLYGRCEEGMGLPYQPYAEVLAELVAHAPDALLESGAEEHRRELVRLVPSLGRRLGLEAGARSLDPESERYLLFGGVTSMLAATAALWPTLVVLDDLHWADAQTLALTQHLLTAPLPGPAPLVVLGTYRDSDLEANPPLGRVLAALRREPLVDRIGLSGLSPVELVELMEHAAGHTLDETTRALALDLHRETNGNPFFSAELLRHLAEAGVIQEEGGRWLLRGAIDDVRLPAGITEIVEQRLQRLDPETARTLRAAAVIGREFPLDLLSRVVEDDEDAVLDRLDEAAAWSLVRNDGPDRFSFLHALVAHSLYEGLSPTRRSRTHRRVASALEALGGDQDDARAAEVAHHLYASGDPVERERTLSYMERAADHALEHLSPDEAARWFTRALELNGDAESALATRCRLLVGLGTAQRDAGQAAYRQTLLDAARLARRIGATDDLVAAALGNSRGYAPSGAVDEEYLEIVRAALDTLGEDRPRERALLLSTLVSQLAYSGTPLRDRLELAEQARRLARRTDDPILEAGVNVQMYLGVLSPATLPERLRNSEMAADTTAGRREPTVDFFVALNRYDSLLEAGDVAHAEEWLRECERTSEEVRQPLLRWTAAWVSVALLVLRGELEAAEARAEAALTLGNECGQADALAIYGAQLLSIRFHQGRLGELHGVLAAYVEANPGIPAFRNLLALAQCELGLRADAEALFDLDAADGFASVPEDPLWATGIAMNAELCRILGRRDAAPALYRLLEPFAGQTASSAAANWGVVTRYLGMLAAVVGRFDEAEAHFADALRRHETMGAPIWAARTRLDWASMLLERNDPGDAAQARTLLQASVAGAEAHGAGGVVRSATHALEVLDA